MDAAARLEATESLEPTDGEDEKDEDEESLNEDAEEWLDELNMQDGEASEPVDGTPSSVLPMLYILADCLTCTWTFIYREGCDWVHLLLDARIDRQCWTVRHAPYHQ